MISSFIYLVVFFLFLCLHPLKNHHHNNTRCFYAHGAYQKVTNKWVMWREKWYQKAIVCNCMRQKQSDIRRNFERKKNWYYYVQRRSTWQEHDVRWQWAYYCFKKFFLAPTRPLTLCLNRVCELWVYMLFCFNTLFFSLFVYATRKVHRFQFLFLLKLCAARTSEKNALL